MNKVIAKEMYEIGKRMGKDVRINKDEHALLFKNLGEFSEVFKEWGKDKNREFVKRTFMELRSEEFFNYVIVM